MIMSPAAAGRRRRPDAGGGAAFGGRVGRMAESGELEADGDYEGVAFATVQGLRPRPPPPVDVTTSVAKRGPITRLVTAAGHLQAHQTVKVSSNISGDLLSLAVKEGDHVAHGQVLGQIDRRLQESQVAQYRAGVANAKAAIDQILASIAQDKGDLERTRILHQEKLASQSDLDKALTLLKVDEGRLAAQKELVAQTQGQLETALYNLQRATLTAPIDGTVLEIQHKVGELRSGGGATPLPAPIAGLVFWQEEDGATVKAGAKLAKVLYQECYVMAWVHEGKPTRAFKWLELDGDFDLFDDGSLHLLKTPGHTPGESSLYVRLPNRKIVLCGDTTHLRAALEAEATMPLDTDPVQATLSIKRLKAIRDMHEATIWITNFTRGEMSVTSSHMPTAMMIDNARRK